MDTYDGNETPCMLALCRPPTHMIPLSAEIDPAALFIGEMRCAAGTKHNTPESRTFLGKDISNADRCIEWRVASGSFGHWVYRGFVSKDGCILRGQFHLSCLPRKRGTFEFRAIDPDTVEEGARWWPESLAVLTNRVLVRWAVGAVDRRVRQQEVLAGAAAVQAAEEQQG